MLLPYKNIHLVTLSLRDTEVFECRLCNTFYLPYSCQIEGSTGVVTLRQPVDREQRELYRLTIRLSDTLHTTDISQILLVGFQILSTPQTSARFYW
jgi:hypothetical protein